MSERIGWMPGSKSGFSVSHKYTEIKMQKIRCHLFNTVPDLLGSVTFGLLGSGSIILFYGSRSFLFSELLYYRYQ
jgi:hypothetical protein